MNQRIHKRLPVEFVKEVLEAFNDHRISEEEAMQLLGLKRSRLYEIRRQWLRSSEKRPFLLWRRTENTFRGISPEVREWLDRELRYIRYEADAQQGKIQLCPPTRGGGEEIQ